MASKYKAVFQWKQFNNESCKNGYVFTFTFLNDVII